MAKKHITLVVTAINNTDMPAPGVPFIRGVRESEFFDVHVIGLVYENLEPGIYMEGLCDRIYQIPQPVLSSDELFERLEYIHQLENIDILVPFFDAELLYFVKNEERLQKLGIHTFMPTLKQFQEREKYRLPEFGKKYGIKVPPSFNMGSLGQITEMEEKFDYPVMVKGQHYDANLVSNKEQVRQAFLKISGKWGLPVIAQEFVSGTEVNVVALGDGNGNTVAAVPMRKQYVSDKGKAWGGITLADEKLMEITRSIIGLSKWKGGLELEMIKTKAGDFYLIEINPRIPAWVYLAVGAGQNIPEALVMLALDMKIEPMQHYKIGKMFVRYSYDMIVDLEKFAAISMNKEI